MDKNEKQHFLEWRKCLAQLQEDQGVLLTPYEKNLEFWRQLWRVVERSDVVVQIVDGRNPLLFRCEDLENYVKEISGNKLNLILINKSDFLTKDQRQHWADYFSMQGIKVVFFSAELASKNGTTDISRKGEDDDNDEDETEKFTNVETVRKRISNLQNAVEENADALNKIIDNIEEVLGKTNLRDKCDVITENSSSLLNTSELINLFKIIHAGPKVSFIKIQNRFYSYFCRLQKGLQQ